MKKAIIYIIIAILAFGSGTFLIIKKSNKDDSSDVYKKTRNECEPLLGGSYNLIFESNSEEKIENMSICIACDPSTYENLPTPVREGYDFDGWYYDKELTNKVMVTNTIDIVPISKKEKGCVVGYEDITLYGNWNKKEEIVEQPTEEPSIDIPEVLEEDNQQSRVVEPNPDPSSQKIFKKPTTVGRLMREKAGSPKFLFTTKANATLYSISTGRVEKIFYVTGITSVNGSSLADIYIVSRQDNTAYIIEYAWVESNSVSVGQNVTSDTIIGKVPIISKKYLPYIYVNIYKFDCGTDEFVLTPEIFQILKKRIPENPMKYMDISGTDEIWESR